MMVQHCPTLKLCMSPSFLGLNFEVSLDLLNVKALGTEKGTASFSVFKVILSSNLF